MTIVNPFLAYSEEQRGKPVPPPKLVAGPMTTRAQARTVYAQIVAELHSCEDEDTLATYLFTVGEELIQFEAELDFLWEGDGQDFAGLNNEIAAAKARVAQAIRDFGSG